MATIRMRYVDHFPDRHGVERFYFRRAHGPRIALPGLPGSTEFMEAYKVALDGGARRPAPAQTAGRASGAGSLAWLIASYRQSRKFKELKPSSQTVYLGMLRRLERDYGIAPAAELTNERVELILAAQPGPGAVNSMLRTLRLLMRHAIKQGIRRDDPTLGIEKSKLKEWRSWTEEEIAAYERHWPIGTRERLAFALHLYTGQRRGDVSVMTWRDITGDTIKVVQEKTGAKLTLPLHSRLQEILAGSPRDHVAIITTQYGAPFQRGAYSDWMKRAIAEVGLPEDCVPHGLRKAAGRRLAEAGATPHQIMAMLGHKTLAEAERYTRGAEQAHLARAGMDLIEPRRSQPRIRSNSQPRVKSRG